MNSTIITDRTPTIATCAVCGHAGTHAPPTVTRSGGVKYCSTCPECEADLEQMVNENPTSHCHDRSPPLRASLRRRLTWMQPLTLS